MVECHRNYICNSHTHEVHPDARSLLSRPLLVARRIRVQHGLLAPGLFLSGVARFHGSNVNA